MSQHLKQNRLHSGVIFYQLPKGTSASSDTRRHNKLFKPATPIVNNVDEESAPHSNADRTFPTFLGGLQSSARTASPASLTLGRSEHGPRVQSPELELPPALCLPILAVTVDVTVDGTVATTELKQSFLNPSELVVPEAQYTFPLYDGAIVTSFECIIGESRILRGVVKPKKEARQIFEKAKQKREATALLEELTPEIFETSLGNIPQKTKVDIILRYIHELKVVQVPQATGLAVTLPTSIAPRYGHTTGLTMPSVLDGNGLKIRVWAVDNGHIDIGGCYAESGHEVNFEKSTRALHKTISTPAELIGIQNQTLLVWQYATKETHLTRDFIFVIQMLETYRLSWRAVFSPADEDGSAALMVNLRPSELFSNAVMPNAFTGEIIFVLDRSSSMGWTEEGSNELKISAMRDAMRLALSGLEGTSCAFNIISFGHEVRGIWMSSHETTCSGSIKKAQDYVRRIKADMGGTNILEAIRAAVKHRDPSRKSTQIIVLTDGEVEEKDNQPILECVWTMRKDLGDHIRFFALGIGDVVSRRLLETIAELGGGYCDIIDVVQRPHWEDRLNRMLRSTMGPDSWTCSVEIGNRYQRRTLMDSNIRGIATADPASIPYIQAPSPVPPLHPYAHKSIFLLLDAKDCEMPKSVTIWSTTPGAKKKVKEVIVELSTSRIIHHLAAKAALKNMEDDIKRGSAETDVARSNAEALGIKYSITSKWTSFVAVSNDEAEKQTGNIDIYQSLLREMAMEDILRLDMSDQSDIESASSSAISAETDVAMPKPSLRLGRPPQLSYFVRPLRPVTMPLRPARQPPPIFYAPPPPSPPPPAVVMEETTAIRDISPGRSNSTISSTTSQISRTPLIVDVRREEISEVPVGTLVRSELEHGGLRSQSDQYTEHERHYVEEPYRECQGELRDVEVRYRGCQGERGEPGQYEERVERIEDSRRMDTIAPQIVAEDMSDSSGISSSSSRRSLDLDQDFDVDSDAASEVQEEDTYRPSVSGPIMWTDAVGSQCGGLFVLPDVIRAKLHQHFCTGASAWVREELARYPAFSALPSERKVALVDTLMMIVYFSTHLALDEDYWYLIMDKAEGTVLLELGLDNNLQDGVEQEPVFAGVKLSIEHAHFKQAQMDAQVERGDQREAPAEGIAVACQVCQEGFGTAEGIKGAARAFVCLSDECFVGGERKVWETWGSYWKHQIDCGHLLCSEGFEEEKGGEP